MFKILLILLFITFIFSPVAVLSAEILQINSSNTVIVGDQNRNLKIKLYCVQIQKENEQTAVDILKKQFPRGSKIKIKPFGFEDNILVAKVFNINETNEMTKLLISNDLSEGDCQN